MTDETPTDATTATTPDGSIKFDGPRSIEWGKLVPTDASDPDALIIRSDNKIARDAEFCRWLRRHGTDERFVQRVEFSIPKLQATVYAASGATAGDDPEVIVLDTKDGKPVLLPPSIITFGSEAELPPIIWNEWRRVRGGSQ